MDYQPDTGSSSTINSLTYLIAAHQTEPRSRPSNKTNTTALSDHVDIRYPKDSIGLESEKKVISIEMDILNCFEKNTLVNLYWIHLNYTLSWKLLFYSSYWFKISCLSYWPHENTNIWRKNRGNPHNAQCNARLLAILIKNREFKLIPDGIEINQVEVV